MTEKAAKRERKSLRAWRLLWARVVSRFTGKPVKLAENVSVRLPSLPIAEKDDAVAKDLDGFSDLPIYVLNSGMEFVMDDIRVPNGKAMYRLRHVSSKKVIHVDEALFRFLFSQKRT